MTAAALPRLLVVSSCGDRRRGFLRVGAGLVPCALGRAGIRSAKREGDGATPRGPLHPVAVLYRADRGPRPRTALPVGAIRPDSGWCDDPADRAYNQPVRLPFAAHHERLWREDRLYDVVVVLDYNMHPVRRGAGSAIFLHIAGDAFAPTAGCIAVTAPVMRRLLARIGPRTVIRIV